MVLFGFQPIYPLPLSRYPPPPTVPVSFTTCSSHTERKLDEFKIRYMINMWKLNILFSWTRTQLFTGAISHATNHSGLLPMLRLSANFWTFCPSTYYISDILVCFKLLPINSNPMESVLDTSVLSQRSISLYDRNLPPPCVCHHRLSPDRGRWFL